MESVYNPPVSFQAASQRADSVLKQLTLDEKLSLIGGEKSFFIKGIERFGFPDLYMADATQGVHIRDSFIGEDFGIEPMEKSTAFPCPLLLASTWNPDLAYRYAEAVGEECRAGGVAVLLGPGLNLYRISQCGRNFEYFGEDPYLVSRMIEKYIVGLQSTGTIATLKHFVANNSDYYRRKSNSVVSERALHELYLPGFKAGVDAGAMAVMTSYNLVNGEWAGQSEWVINDLLRTRLGFRWLVMTDWWSVWDGEKVIQSGQDLEMPGAEALKSARKLLQDGRVSEDQINRMVKSILTTVFAMDLYNRPLEDKSYYDTFTAHEEVALETAREGIVLLKNDGLLPLGSNTAGRILVTGSYVTENAFGGGAAHVKGYNTVTFLDALKAEFDDRIVYVENPSDEELKEADAVIVSTGTPDSEGWDRPFDLPEAENGHILRCLGMNPRCVVVVHSGSGMNMTPWEEKAGAVVYSWYKGQVGNRALAEILSGRTNPSGKLPVTIERRFEDSPGFGYVPEGESLYTGWNGEEEKAHPVFDVVYDEGIFVGYRWYEHRGIEPLYPFGHGLSYSRFSLKNLKIDGSTHQIGDPVRISLQVENTGDRRGAEVIQVYVRDEECSLPRPEKELKGFVKVALDPGEKQTVDLALHTDAFAFWHPKEKDWVVEAGRFTILVGTSSAEIRLSEKVTIIP